MPRLFSECLLRGGCGVGILEDRIDFTFQNVGPLGYVLGDGCQVGALDEMPAENRPWDVPPTYGLGSSRDRAAPTEKFFDASSGS